MKLGQALRQKKHYEKRLGELQIILKNQSVSMSNETPEYKDRQKEAVEGFINEAYSISRERARLCAQIAMTNAVTKVSPLGPRGPVEMTLSEAVEFYRFGAHAMDMVLRVLGTKATPAERVEKAADGSSVVIKKELHYDAADRDRRMKENQEFTEAVKTALEIANATVDLVEIPT